jgi:hypothetical protein
MNHVPFGVLLSPPKSLSRPWKAAFEALTDPILVAHSLLRNPDLAELPGEALAEYLRGFQLVMPRLTQALAELDAVAPLTWDAGYAILAAVEPALATLCGLRTLELQPAAARPRVVAYIKDCLKELRDGLDELPLLRALRAAVAAEKDIDLPWPVPGGGRTPSSRGKYRNAARDAWLDEQRDKTPQPTWPAIWAHLERIATKKKWNLPRDPRSLQKAHERYLKNQRERGKG